MRLGPRYQVLALLGEGAMGQVFLVRHLELGRKEAVKVLKPEVARDERFVARFRREARATNRLNHPNIVAMYDFGRLPDGRFYLAMEYVDGASLSRVLAEGDGLSQSEALIVISQLAAAIEHAHSRGVLHRDLKPANLMLIQRKGRDDLLKVLDFGVAKIISPEYRESVMVSQEGIVFGTPLYMAPEQFESSDHDPRSDIYAVGCIGFELLTGEPPFFGKISEVVMAHAEQAPPRVSDLVAGAPRELDRIILRCLAKDPARRYQTGGELLADLVTLHPQHGEATGPSDSGPVPNLSRYDLYQSYDADTMHSTVGRDPAGQDNGEADEEDEETRRTGKRQALLLELAQAFLDRGISDVRLTVTVADARALDRGIEQCDAERAELAERGSRAEQARRERESMLRFAVGELRFDRDRGCGDPDLDYQISELESRLAELLSEAEAPDKQLAEEATELVVRRAEIEARRPQIYRRLHLLVEEYLANSAKDAHLASRVARYRALCEDQ